MLSYSSEAVQGPVDRPERRLTHRTARTKAPLSGCIRRQYRSFDESVDLVRAEAAPVVLVPDDHDGRFGVGDASSSWSGKARRPVHCRCVAQRRLRAALPVMTPGAKLPLRPRGEAVRRYRPSDG